MAVTGSITTRFIDEKGVDLGKTLIEKDYLISVYPNLLNQFDTPMLMTWGRNSVGQLGDNTTTNKSSPVQTVAYGANWKQISNATQNMAAIKTDGTLWLWGRNSYGGIGDNTNINRSSPVQTVAFGTNWKQVSCGYIGAAAIKTDGTLWCWGYNFFGQVGDNTVTFRSSPVQTVAFGTNWKQVSSGYLGGAAIKTDGTLWRWGYNSVGELGDNTTTNRSSPVQTVTRGTNWKQVSAKRYMTAAIKTDGTLWTWGFNAYGLLGDNTTTSRSSPVQTIARGTNWMQVSCGNKCMAAIKTDGTLWTWGRTQEGQLGDNTVTNRSSPIQTISYGTNWKQVSCGYNNVAAIKTDGTLWIWGTNSGGELGDNTVTSRSSPVQTVLYGNNWKQVSCGYCTAAIKDGDF
jgi:alpha-tubulin suppressor-like RCC1 family protein